MNDELTNDQWFTKFSQETLQDRYHEELELNKEIQEWMDDGNAEEIGKDRYIEQSTQWKKTFTLTGLKEFFVKEFK
jgi:hypothetical protein